MEELARLDKGHSDAPSTVIIFNLRLRVVHLGYVFIIGAFAEDLEARALLIFMYALDDILVGI